MTTSNATFDQSVGAGFSRSNPKNVFHRVIGWAPIAVGLIFLYYGAGKALDLNPTIISIQYLTGKTPAAKVLAVIVAAVDIYFALTLLMAKRKRWPVLGTICCLGAYSCFLGYLVSMRHPPSCGCGGMMKFFTSNRANAAVGLVRNIGLMSYLGAYYYFRQRLKASTVAPHALVEAKA